MKGKAVKRASGVRLPQELQDRLVEAGRDVRIKERTTGEWRGATATEMVTAGAEALLALLAAAEEVVDLDVFREAGAVQFFRDPDGKRLTDENGKPVFSRSSPLSRDLYDELAKRFRPVTEEEEKLLASDARFIEPGSTAEVRGTVYSGAETDLLAGDFILVESISAGKRSITKLTSAVGYDRFIDRARKAWATDAETGEKIHIFDLEVVEEASTEGIEQ